MKFIRSLCMAFSMYSKLPVPRVEWKEENMAYALCFFPLIGAVIGLFTALWFMAATALSFNFILTAAVASLIPFAVSGGIHTDGFCDTSDALYSHQSKERMLEIMKDSHVGAGAIMSLAAYMLLNFGLWTQIDAGSNALFVMIIAPITARAYSALAAVTFRSASGKGLLASFSSSANTGAVIAVSVIWIIISSAVSIWRGHFIGIAASAAALVMFLIYRLVAYRKFGGTTGDIAGWFVEMCQLIIIAAAVIAQSIGSII